MRKYVFSEEVIDRLEGMIIEDFRKCFLSYGYMEHEAVSMNSKIDTSVYFVGSTISVLKPYILTKMIPEKGYFLVQRCIRSQNLKKLGTNDELNWSSYFRSIGTLSPYNRLQEIGEEIICFFTDYLNISLSDILVRVSSKDKDLVDIWQYVKSVPNLEIDSKEDEYYKHKYGMDNIVGRNLNFAIRGSSENEYEDIGNLIVIEEVGGEKIAVELAFGISTIMSKMFSLQNSIQSSVICKYASYKDGLQTHFLDALAVVVHLEHEGLNPSASNTRGRILRSYIRIVKVLYEELGYTLNQVCEIAEQYEYGEYCETRGVATRIKNHIDR